MYDLDALSFCGPIRPYLESLTNLLRYANSREDGRWAWQCPSRPENHGVYGHASNTVEAILREEFGVDIARRAMCHLEFGCCHTWLADLEWALSKAISDDRDYDDE